MIILKRIPTLVLLLITVVLTNMSTPVSVRAEQQGVTLGYVMVEPYTVGDRAARNEALLIAYAAYEAENAGEEVAEKAPGQNELDKGDECIKRSDPDYEGALKYYRQAADLGNSVAQLRLGEMHAKGIGTPVDYTQALKLFSKAAAQGSRYANLNLGWLYYYGHGVPKDYAKAITLFSSGVSDEAQLCEAVTYAEGHGGQQGYAKAHEIFLSLAQKKYSSTRDIAIYNLGLMYANGHGVPKDCDKAREWFSSTDDYAQAKKDAEERPWEALSKAYRGDTSPDEDPMSILKYDASVGYTPAILELGFVYSEGKLDTPQNLVEAHKWFNLAAVRCSPDAAEMRDTLASLMTEEQVSQAVKLAKDWRQRNWDSRY